MHRTIAVVLGSVLSLSVQNAGGGELDYGTVTCGQFLASGHDNMAALFMWLRGYHAGKTGKTPYQNSDSYPGRLGFFCRQHSETNLLEASEKILTAVDRGI